MIDSTIVSQSENDSYLKCRRAHFYAYGERLQPKSFGPGITRGNIAHAFMEVLYNAIKNGANIQGASTYALNRLNQFYIEGTDPSLLVLMRNKLTGYVDFYHDEDQRYEILAVEKEFRQDNFAFKVDLIKRDRKTGKVYLVDHKTLYNFYNGKIIELLPQLPKYAGYLERQGLPVDFAEYNMIRWRPDAVKSYDRHAFEIPNQRKSQFMFEQDQVTNEILEMRSHPTQLWENLAVRTANSFTCGNCWFADLCSHDLNGYHGRGNLINAKFVPNTYGYMEESD